MPNSFVKKVQQYAFHRGLLRRGDKIVVGISGGPDSVALTCVLNKLKEKQDFQIKLVHVNYHQREDESNKDEKFVRNFAEESGLSLEAFDYNPGESKNLEEDMRNFRYKVFEEVLSKNDFNKIAIGHTKDDSVETFLMNLIRGSGVEGITSLRDQRGKIIRPLMCCEKSEILDFLKGFTQEICIDKSNFDIKFSRNRIRENLIPLLQKDYNNNIKEHIIDLAGHLRDDLEIIEDVVEKVYNDKVVVNDKEIIIKVSDLLEMPVALQKRIFRKIIMNIVGDTKNISTANFFEFEKIIKGEKSKISEMKIRNLLISKRGEEVRFKNI